MTAREYAKSVGVEIVGKLEKKSVSREKYDVRKGDFVEEKIAFYIDKAGNEFYNGKNGWCVITADGGVI